MSFSRNDPSTPKIREVAIKSVDVVNHSASAVNRFSSTNVENINNPGNQIFIDTSHYVGATQVQPAPGEQWHIQQINGQWRLHSRISYNDPNQTLQPTAGQHVVGSGNGPVELCAGPNDPINANSVLNLFTGNSPLPDASTVAAGGLAYDTSNTVPTYSNGTTWNPLATSAGVTAQVATKYTLPVGGVPSSDMSTSVQSALGLANTSLQSLSGSPYDLSIVCAGAVTTRATGTNDNPFGVKLQRAATFTSVTFRCATADASGNLVVELRRNGSTISGTSTTIASGSQVAGGTSTFTQSCSTGDVISIYITAVGTTPGLGLSADVLGVMN